MLLSHLEAKSDLVGIMEFCLCLELIPRPTIFIQFHREIVV